MYNNYYHLSLIGTIYMIIYNVSVICKVYTRFLKGVLRSKYTDNSTTVERFIPITANCLDLQIK